VAQRASARSALSVVDDDVPRRLRAERERRGISLRELARRLQISPSAISQIETGRARPSVATLWAIVTELGMSLDDLFAHEAGGPPRGGGGPRAGAADGAAGGDGRSRALPVVSEATREALQLATGVRWERMTADADPDVDFIWVVYDVGGSSSPDDGFIRHAGREYGLVVSGRLEVTVGFESTVLGPGDSISFDSTTPHRLRNAGDEPVTGVWVVVGRRTGPRAEGAPPEPGGRAAT
jgi:mannose-6-phosphate isomerase-like protein (cupin superfamily)/DNA-binding XRE family transcriptional regulator